MWIIDRLEEGVAVCERDDGSFVTLSLEFLPEGCHEGSVLLQNEAGQFLLCPEQERARREALYELQLDLFE